VGEGATSTSFQRNLKTAEDERHDVDLYLDHVLDWNIVPGFRFEHLTCMWLSFLYPVQTQLLISACFTVHKEEFERNCLFE